MNDDPHAHPHIEPVPDGPLRYRCIGADGERGALRGPDGAEVPVRESALLCRCGASDRKPFCDGSHVGVGFTSARLRRGEGSVTDYAGARITIHDDRGRCAHVEYCVTGLPEVFRRDVRPWIDPDAASVEAIIAICEKCPSGALRYSIDGVPAAPPEREPAVIASADGPYFLEGGVTVVDDALPDGAVTGRCTLCRCGASRNKPLCDGKHWDVGFTDRTD